MPANLSTQAHTRSRRVTEENKMSAVSTSRPKKVDVSGVFVYSVSSVIVKFIQGVKLSILFYISQPLSKKTPANPKYDHVKSVLDTGMHSFQIHF